MRIQQRSSAIEAYYDTDHSRMETRVYRYVLGCGSRGATILEIATALGVASNCVTGRLNDMLDKENGGKNAKVCVAQWKRHCDVNTRQRKIVWLAIVKAEQMGLFGRVA